MINSQWLKAVSLSKGAQIYTKKTNDDILFVIFVKIFYGSASSSIPVADFDAHFLLYAN